MFNATVDSVAALILIYGITANLVKMSSISKLLS